MKLTCNSTLEELRIIPGSEILLVGPLTFHDLARIVAASCTLIATTISLYLIWKHAINYTQPHEQRYIIRILFMVPVYAVSSLFQIQWYWHAIYFKFTSSCYEALAIASFFALICYYVAPDLNSQKHFFREMRPISGLRWFKIIWTGIYQYCFIRVATTISAVVSQYFNRYCERSFRPVFGHIWITVINTLAVTIAMTCLIKFYAQLKNPLAEQKLFLKILAIKLVIFLSFFQDVAISFVRPNHVLAYPDIKVGTPALLQCIEMACFAILHLWAFPYAPYVPGAPATFYPVPDPDKAPSSRENKRSAPSGGFIGILALFDALNLWDVIKAFGRGMRWLFCGVKRRKNDISYRQNHGDALEMDKSPERPNRCTAGGAKAAPTEAPGRAFRNARPAN